MTFHNNPNHQTRTSQITKLGVKGFAFEFLLEAFVALDAQDGQAPVLTGLGQAEEDSPQYALCCDADGQEHLGK